MKKPTEKFAARVLASLPGQLRRRPRWIDAVDENDRADLDDLRRQWQAGSLGCSAAALARAIAQSASLTVRPHTIEIWLKERS